MVDQTSRALTDRFASTAWAEKLNKLSAQKNAGEANRLTSSFKTLEGLPGIGNPNSCTDFTAVKTNTKTTGPENLF